MMELETVSIAELRPHPRNYRKHPDDQIEHLIASIRDNGLYRNIVIARDKTILAGHGVVKAAQKMGIEEVPVVRLDLDSDAPQALKILAGDNEIEHLAEQDDRALSELLKEIYETDADGLLGTGYDEMMLASLAFVTRSADEIMDFDAAAHWVGMPEYDPGPQRIMLNISFLSEKARLKLLENLGINSGISKFSGGHTWSMWWPPEPDDDLIALRFEEA